MSDAESERFDTRTYFRIYDEESVISKRIELELQPLLDNVADNMASLDSFKEMYSDFQRRTAHGNIIAKLMAERVFQDEGEVKDDFLAMFVYLGLVETYGNTLADVAVWLLVANGKDFRIGRERGTPRIKHALSIKDLENKRVSLGTKLNFMRKNGLNESASIVDREVRNDIAHMRLEITNKRVFIRGKPALELSMRNAIRVSHAISIISILLERLARQKELIE
jgi:hypothetical protein